MSGLVVNTKEIAKSSERMKKYSRSIVSSEKLISEIASNIRISDKEAQAIRKQLQDISKNLLEEAAKMDTLSSAILYIAGKYEDVEKSIINGDSYMDDAIYDTENGSNDFFKDCIRKIKEWLIEHGLIKPEKQERVQDEEVTKHQEIEQNLYFQEQIGKLRKKERYTDETWENSTLEEREQILEDYVNEVAAIMGVDIKDVLFFSDDYSDGTMSYGYYKTENQTINLNSVVIEEGDVTNNIPSNYIFLTIAHELRHAYQKSVVDNPEEYVVTDETMDKWKENYSNYKNIDDFVDEGMSTTEAYEAYREQEIEKDARNFAGQD